MKLFKISDEIRLYLTYKELKPSYQSNTSERTYRFVSYL